MSKYTTEVRFICETASGLTESKGFNDINTIITTACPKVFDFDFPIFDENYRLTLEKKILKHFYTREIGLETVGLWKLKLDTRLNEIMPYYNKMYTSELLEFNPLYTVNEKKNYTRNIDADRSLSKNENGSANSSSTSSGNDSNINTNLYSDTPQGALTGVENETYLTNASKTTDIGSNSSNASGTSSSSNVSNGTDNLDSTESYLESVSGYSGVNASELLMKYRETFLNIDMLIIDELEDLFFQLW